MLGTLVLYRLSATDVAYATVPGEVGDQIAAIIVTEPIDGSCGLRLLPTANDVPYLEARMQGVDPGEWDVIP